MFPQIKTIDDVWPYIKDKKEFILIDRGDYLVIDYNYRVSDTFDTPQACECRGIKFLPNGELLSRPMHKFFNVGEKEAGPINWNRPFSVEDKLDGSMVHPAIVQNQLVFMTRQGRTEHAIRAEKLFLDLHKDSMWNWLSFGALPSFEFIGPANPHVVPYKMNSLVHLNTRCQFTGDYLYDAEDSPWHRGFIWEGELGDEEIVGRVKAQNLDEGVVIRFGLNEFYKIKADAYVLRHKIRNDFSKFENVIKLIFSGQDDDVMPMLTAEQQYKYLKAREKVFEGYHYWAEYIDRVVERKEQNNMSRKDIAFEINKDIPIHMRAAFFAALDGKNILKETMMKHYDKLGDIWNEDGTEYWHHTINDNATYTDEEVNI